MRNLNYSKAEIAQGLRLQKETKENPETFGQVDGAATYKPSGDLSKQYSTRMAGEIGAFAEALTQNPQFQQQLSEWNSLFSSTRTGNEFVANPPPSPMEMQQMAMQQQQQQQKPQPAKESTES